MFPKYIAELNVTANSMPELLWYLSKSPKSSPASATTLAGSPPEQNLKSSSPESPSFPEYSAPILIKRTVPSRLYALVIGIDKYMYVQGLKGAVADTVAVNKYLTEKLSVPKDRIINVQNEEATRVKIETEIKNLANNPKIGKNDPILIFYAGHGATVKAPSGWDNKRVEMLLPSDFTSDSSKRGQGVLDKMLSRLLKDLADKKSDNITVILDCCHSGSGTRTDPTFAAREIILPETYVIHEDLLQDLKPDARTSVIPEGCEKAGLSSHVLLSACGVEEKAYETDQGGNFTLALLELLRQHDIDTLPPYEDIPNKLPLTPKQHPQCEGANKSRRLFSTKVASLQGEIYPISASPDKPGQYILNAGMAHGITENAEFAVFADEASAETSETALGTVVVSNAIVFTATCRVQPPSSKPFPLATPGFALQTRVGEGQDVHLSIDPGEERLLPLIAWIRDEMAGNNAGKKRRFCLDEKEPDLVITGEGDFVRFKIMNKICQEQGLPRMSIDVKINDLDRIKQTLRRSADFYWHLNRPTKDTAVDPSGRGCGVTLERVRLKPVDTDWDTRYELDTAYESEELHDKPFVINIDDGGVKVYGFKITNVTEVPLHVSMFYFNISNLKITSYIQPASAERVDPNLPVGETLTIGYGGSGTLPHRYIVPEEQTVDVGFLKLFISTEHVDLSSIAHDDSREDIPVTPGVRPQYRTMRVAVVTKKPGAGQGK